MTLLIFALIVLIIACLALWAVRSVPMPAPGQAIATVIICLVAAIVIMQRAGMV